MENGREEVILPERGRERFDKRVRESTNQRDGLEKRRGEFMADGRSAMLAGGQSKIFHDSASVGKSRRAMTRLFAPLHHQVRADWPTVTEVFQNSIPGGAWDC